jgi:hypothetical protein
LIKTLAVLFVLCTAFAATLGFDAAFIRTTTSHAAAHAPTLRRRTNAISDDLDDATSLLERPHIDAEISEERNIIAKDEDVNAPQPETTIHDISLMDDKLDDYLASPEAFDDVTVLPPFVVAANAAHDANLDRIRDMRKSFAEGAKSNNTDAAPFQIYLVVEVYVSGVPERMDELVRALQLNVDADVFVEMHLACEDEAAKRTFDARIVALPTKTRTKVVYVVRRRQTFAQAFEYANRNLPSGSAAVFANSDIVFDETIALIRESDMGITPRLPIAYALSRNQVEKGAAGRVSVGWTLPLADDSPGEWGDEGGFSQDAWVLRTPIMVPEKATYFFGVMKCDTRTVCLLAQAGYVVHNPMLSIAIYHLHNIRHDEGNADHVGVNHRNDQITGPDMPARAVYLWRTHSRGAVDSVGSRVPVLPSHRCHYYCDRGRHTDERSFYQLISETTYTPRYGGIGSHPRECCAFNTEPRDLFENSENSKKAHNVYTHRQCCKLNLTAVHYAFMRPDVVNMHASSDAWIGGVERLVPSTQYNTWQALPVVGPGVLKHLDRRGRAPLRYTSKAVGWKDSDNAWLHAADVVTKTENWFVKIAHFMPTGSNCVAEVQLRTNGKVAAREIRPLAAMMRMKAGGDGGGVPFSVIDGDVTTFGSTRNRAACLLADGMESRSVSNAVSSIEAMFDAGPADVKAADLEVVIVACGGHHSGHDMRGSVVSLSKGWSGLGQSPVWEVQIGGTQARRVYTFRGEKGVLRGRGKPDGVWADPTR